MKAARVDFVDGGIIGVPVREPGKTRLYLSGNKAEEAVTLCSAGALETCAIGESIGRASMIQRIW
jgi:hypothetical protein